MTIDEAIQSKFKSEAQRAVVNLIYTSKHIELIDDRMMKKFGLTSAQFNVLRILRGQFPKSATVNLLIERMLDKSSNASRLVEKLRTKKLVERIQCPEDRRAVNVKITQKGLDLLTEIDPVMNEMNESLSSIGEEKLKLFNEILDEIRLKVENQSNN